MKYPIMIALSALLACNVWAHGPGGIHSEKSAKADAAFDLVHTRVFKEATASVLTDGWRPGG